MVRRPRKRSTHAFYVVSIERWDWGYGFGVNNIRQLAGAYSEHRHLHLFGSILRPRSIKADEAALTFIPDRDYELPDRDRHEPTQVGSLDIHNRRLNGLFSMPQDALPPILQMLTAERLRFVVMEGEPMRYRRADIRSYHLDLTFDPDDLPEES